MLYFKPSSKIKFNKIIRLAISIGILLPQPSFARQVSSDCTHESIKKELESLNNLNQSLIMESKLENKKMKEIKSNCKSCKDINWSRTDDLALKAVNGVAASILSALAFKLFSLCVAKIALGGAALFSGPAAPFILALLIAESFGFFWISSQGTQLTLNEAHEISSELKGNAKIYNTHKHDLQSRMNNKTLTFSDLVTQIGDLPGYSNLASIEGFKLEDSTSCNNESTTLNPEKIKNTIEDMIQLPKNIKEKLNKEEDQFLNFLKKWEWSDELKNQLKNQNMNINDLNAKFETSFQTFVAQIYSKKQHDLERDYNDLIYKNRSKGSTVIKELTSAYKEKSRQLSKHEHEEALLLLDFLNDNRKKSNKPETYFDKIQKYKDFHEKATALVQYRFATSRNNLNKIMHQSIDRVFNQFEQLCALYSEPRNKTIVTDTDDYISLENLK